MSQRRSKLTQQTLDESFAESVDPVEARNNIVRYIVYRGGEQMHITRSELYRKVIRGKPAGKFEEILSAANKTLRETYGYNLMVCDGTKGKDKHYIVSNLLPELKDPTENDNEVPEDINRVLLLLILSHILMMNNEVSDVSLYTFLKSCGIDVDLRHPVFGNVKDYIHKTLQKKHYLHIDFDNMTKKVNFKWGTRAEKEISKMDILQFVCKVYKDREPKNWTNQFAAASQQMHSFENHRENIKDNAG